jgi:hypothetical protein
MTMKANRSNPFPRGARLLLLGLVTVLALAAAPVEALELDCHVLELPAVIDRPGEYCLDRDWIDSFGVRTAILVQSDHVVIDFRGHLVINTDGLGGVPLSGYPMGVHASERSHVLVRNGTVAGFREGVSLSRPVGSTLSDNHLVEGMRVYDCRRFGIAVYSEDSVVRNNVVYDIVANQDTDPTGIWIGGFRNRVVGNTVSRVIGGGKLNDRWGIRLVDGSHNLVLGNHLAATRKGVYMEDGTTVYRDNVVLELPGGAPAFSGGTDAGGNFP